jgi:DUF1680 family protein
VKAAGGVAVDLEERTHYPFDDTTRLAVTPARAVRFPPYLRISAWCTAAGLAVDGHAAKGGPLAAGQVVRVERQW